MYDQRDFTVGGVLRQTFGLLGRHIGEFAACAFVLLFLPSLAAGTGVVNTVKSYDGSGHLRDTTTSMSFFASSSSLVSVVASVILFGIVVQAGLRDVRGERPNVGSDVGAALKLFFPNLFIALLFYIGIALGFLLLIVPGIMLQCAWCVAIPAYMAERQGVFRAFGRSRALTAGYRWRIFGLLVLYGVAILALGGTSLILTRVITQGGLEIGLLWTLRILVAALSTVTNLTIFASATACYFELSRVKGGILSSDQVEAFA